MNDMPGSPSLAISTVCLSGTLEDKLRAAAAAGFTGVELLEYDLVMSPWSPRRLAEEAAGLGLSVEVYQPFHVETVPPDLFAASLRRAERKFDLLAELGASVLVCCSSRTARGLDDDDLAAEQLHALAEPGRAARPAARLRSGAVGTSAHARGRLADRPASRPPGARAVPRQLPRAVAGQRSRRHRAGARRQGVPRPARRCPATEHGCPRVEPPLPDVPRPGLARRGGLPRPDPGHGLHRPDGARGLQRRLPAGGSPARRHRRDALDARPRRGGGRARLAGRSRAAPAPATCRRLPSSAGSRSPSSLSTRCRLLWSRVPSTALGFAHVGQHRSMPVQLWEQGRARVLLNLAPQRSIAPATASICALGVESADPAASMRRADAAARAEAAPTAPT